MAQNVTVKVVSQRTTLEYHGVGSKSSLVAASKMRQLLQGNALNDASTTSKSSERSSTSYTLFGRPVKENGKEADKIQDPLTLVFEPVLTKLKSYEEQEAIRKRVDFFESVEAGKKSLVEKFGKRIPNDEIMKLASSLRGKACTIWKHQVITTVTSDTEFRGSHKTREGKFTSSVKSKTVYTLQPLTEAQLEELKALLLSEKQISTNSIATRVSRGGYTTWDSSRSGKIIFEELKAESSVLET